jgi:hypothetical protein
MTLEAKRIQRLIDDLEAGRPVDPAEIDRALERRRSRLTAPRRHMRITTRPRRPRTRNAVAALRAPPAAT